MMKLCFWIVLLCAGFLTIAACDSDDPAVTQNIPLTEFVIPSSDYLNHRFFKLDLPAIESPGGRHQGDQILSPSIRIFQMISEGIPDLGDITNVAAYVDSLGFRNWDGINFSEPHQFGPRWREIYLWDFLIEPNGDFMAVDLRAGMSDGDVLAVIYEVKLADGSIVKVGDLPGRDIPQQEVIGGDGLFYRMKLLKAPVSHQEPHTFQYVLRNIYSLGAANIDQTTFDLRIERNVAGSAQPRYDETGLDYLRIFGLDRDDFQRSGHPDGLVDWWDPLIFDLQKGLLKFPLDFPMPFAPGGEIIADGDQADQIGRAYYEANADTAAFVWDPSYLRENQSWQLYHPSIFPSDYPQFTSFRIIATYGRPDKVAR